MFPNRVSVTIFVRVTKLINPGTAHNCSRQITHGIAGALPRRDPADGQIADPRMDMDQARLRRDRVRRRSHGKETCRSVDGGPSGRRTVLDLGLVAFLCPVPRQRCHAGAGQRPNGMVNERYLGAETRPVQVAPGAQGRVCKICRRQGRQVKVAKPVAAQISWKQLQRSQIPHQDAPHSRQ